MKRRFFTFLLVFIITSVLFAQYPNWENITNTNMVTSLYNDGDTLWVGTMGGLVKYNKKTGDSFCYTKANAGLPSNCILGLTKDSKQNLWIACRFNGVGCFKNGTCSTFNRINTDMTYDEWCQGIYVDKNDTVFFGPLFSFNRIYNNQLKSMQVGNLIMSIPQYVKDIVLSPDGSLVLSTSYGLYNYRQGTYTLMHNQTAECNVARFDKMGNLWVGTTKNGLYKYTNDTVLNYNSINSVCPDRITYCMIAKNNEIWISDKTGIINFKESGTSAVYNINLKNDQISALSENDTCIWVGTMQHGLYRFRNGIYNKVRIYNTGLKSNFNGLLEVMDSSVLISGTKYDGHSFTYIIDTLTGLKTNPYKGTKVWKNKGLFTYGDKTILGYYEDGNWTYFNQFQTDYIKDLVPVSPDTFWITTSNRGLLKYQAGQILEYNSTNTPLPKNSLVALTMDKKGVLWGSFGSGSASDTIPGIFSFDGTNWLIWTKTEVSYLSYLVTSIKFDSQNHLWCNSMNYKDMMKCKGLIRYDGINWSLYDTSNSLLPTNTIYDIYVDASDTIWTAGVGGATKFDRQKKWDVYTIYNSGLAFVSVQGVVRLPNGDVYFSHDYGGLSVLKSGNSLSGIPTVTTSDDLKIYPVPVHDILNVQIPTSGSYKIDIYDLTGKPIYLSTWKQTSQTSDLQTINTSSFSKGIYLLQLKTDNGSYSKKLVIR